MLYLTGGNSEALVALPTTLDVSAETPLTKLLTTCRTQKAVQLAIDKFSIPKDTHIVRLSCRASEMPIIGACAAGSDVFL